MVEEEEEKGVEATATGEEGTIGEKGTKGTGGTEREADRRRGRVSPCPPRGEDPRGRGRKTREELGPRPQGGRGPTRGVEQSSSLYLRAECEGRIRNRKGDRKRRRGRRHHQRTDG